MSNEKRDYPRAEIKWPAVIKTDQGTMDGVTSNVTPNVAFIHCQKPLRINEIFELTIDIPNSDQILTARAEVTWSNRWGPDDDISPRGRGVRFVKISKEDRRIIARKLVHYEVGQEACYYLDTLELELKQL